MSIKITSGPAIERTGDLAAILTNLRAQDILFIDEIHRLSRVVEEVLYPAMEDYALDIIIGKGPGAKSLRLKLPPFTLIGATTRYAMLSAPLRDRFGVVQRLDFYDEESIEKILHRSAAILQVKAETAGLKEIACRARGTPRVANRLLKRVRDYAQVMAQGIITKEVADLALTQLEVDPIGLDEIDHKILHIRRPAVRCRRSGCGWRRPTARSAGPSAPSWWRSSRSAAARRRRAARCCCSTACASALGEPAARRLPGAPARSGPLGRASDAYAAVFAAAAGNTEDRLCLG